MRLAASACLALASLTFAAAPAPAPVPAATPTAKPKTATVSGVVTGPDGKPLAGAIVRAVTIPKEAPQRVRAPRPEAPKPVTAKTGTDGTFKIEGLPDGTLAVRVESPGLAPAFADKVPSGASLTLKLKPGVTVVGRVLDLKTQRPFGGATVRAIEKDAARFGREAAHTGTTAEDGTFRIADCAPGIVQIDAIGPQTAKARLDNVLARAPRQGETIDPATNTLYLQPGGKIAGKVSGPDGKPLEGVTISAQPAEGNLLAMFREGGANVERSDANGKYVLEGLPAGTRYNVTGRKTGLTDGEAGPIAIEAGTDRQDVDLKLDTGAAITFRLVTVDDTPVSDTDVRVDASGERRGGRGRGGPRLGLGIVSDDQIVPGGSGKFTVRNLEAGTFDVTLSPADGADIIKEAVVLRSGETVDLGTLKVKESKSISGRVTDGTGQPVAGASIGTFWMEGGQARIRDTRSRTDGTYKLAGLGDETLGDVWVNAEGFAPFRKDGLLPGDTSANFTLEKMGTVTGRVLLPEGAAPVAFKVEAHPEARAGEERPGMRMVVNRNGLQEPNQVFSDPQGNFRLENVAPGMVTIEVKADGYAPSRKKGIDVRSDAVADAGTLTLSLGRTVRGRVLAAKDDLPVAGATVSLSQAQGFGMRFGGEDAEAVAVTGMDGAFAVAGLESRTYTVAAAQPDYSPNNGRVEVPSDADVDDFVIRLSKGGTLTGTVRDAQKQPVQGATVLIAKIPMGGGPQTVSTGPDGRYTVEKMAPGDYIVMRQNAGGPVMIMAGIKQATVKEGETTTFDLDEAAKINLTGRVLKGDQPVANAMLFFSKAGGGSGAGMDMHTGQSDASGKYQMGLDEAGSYNVSVSTGGRFGGGMSAIKIEVPDQPTPVLDITMRAAGIVGKVSDHDGKPVANAMISARFTGDAQAGPRGSMNASTGGDGNYSVDNLTAGSYEVSVQASGFKSPSPTTVSIANDSDQPVADFQLEAGRSFRGQVVDPQGNGISGASVVVAPAGSNEGTRGMPTQTDINGSFVMTAPGDGAIDLTAVAPGFAAARMTGVMVPSDDQPLRVQTPRGGRVRVTALGSDGTPVRGASVVCAAKPAYLGSYFASFMNPPSPTGTDGASTIGPLSPGSYEVTVSSAGKRQTQPVNITEGGEAVVSVVLP